LTRRRSKSLDVDAAICGYTRRLVVLAGVNYNSLY
jgi:hypothetical protein